MESVIAINTFVRENLSTDTVIPFDAVLNTDLTNVFNICGISDWETNDRALVNSVTSLKGDTGMTYRVRALVAALIRMKYFELLVNRNGVSDYRHVQMALFDPSSGVRLKRVRFASH